jgi:RimJ/RimL family protein N-acetyltransferase
VDRFTFSVGWGDNLDVLALVALHLELECVGFDAQGDLTAIPCTNPDTLPRFYIIKHNDGDTRYFRDDVALNVRTALNALSSDVALHDAKMVCSILSGCDDIHMGKSYIFPKPLSFADYSDVVRLESHHQALIERYEPQMNVNDRTIYAIIVDTRIISTCESSRENDKAGEAWVRTLPEYRGRGYAHQVTAAWAHSLQQQGKVPFYSHTHTNTASAAVARKLHLIQYIEDAVYA